MSLTVEEIVKWQEALSRVQSDGSVVLPPGSNVLCHMALASLTEREKGYREGIKAVAKHFDSLADGRWDTGAIAVEIRSIVPPAQPKEKA